MIIQHPTHLFERFFFWLGFNIGRHPVRVIVGTLGITMLMALGMLRFEEVNNVRTEYSPMNSPSKLEYSVAKMFLKQVRADQAVFSLGQDAVTVDYVSVLRTARWILAT